MSPRQAGMILTLLMYGAGGSFIIAAFKSFGTVAVLSWLLVGMIVVARHFASRCPRCSKSMFIYYLLGEETWFQRHLFYMRPWPERTCSRCMLDLTTN